MFYHIDGVVKEMQKNLAVVECGGVGFGINCTDYTLSSLAIEHQAKLFLSEVISENSFELYGFYTKEEQNLFNLLISISGVGPKAALSILSYNTVDSLSLAVINGDDKPLTAAPGIGKKTAQRIILEMKDKLKGYVSTSVITSGTNYPDVNQTASSAVSDASAALNVLGYTSAEVMKVFSGVQTSGMTTEQLIKLFLKQNAMRG